ncbi:ABC transporter permease [Microbacterium dextranolyticum]|uniref:Nitrate ABC transporter permease n=1 Tax=Microbacterium dextranolyticum TaxID=36806 RepID=A0A9W6HNR5_9MICO|nr:ABC transporter permease [Microbacterium dextranolyticum]MBM7462945.1 NitT/TauT family transport system permease protein [Microbacterium dextranolyticum]GLJ95950.1 nitrate ABC transporter permease [Microbacterium dextranolyticum]
MSDVEATASESVHTVADPREIAAEQASVPRKRAPRWTKPSLWVPPILLLALIIGLVYLVNALLGTRGYLMPQPHVIFAVYADPKSGPEIFGALWNTAQVALVGLIVAIVIGVVWAIAMNLAKWVERTTFPYAVILQSIPILAVVPLIGFWFGYDFIARTIVCVLIALFPIVSNTLFGLQSVDRGARELFKLQKATRWVVLTKLELPTALPAMFAGMRISAGLSIVGAIVGDFFFQRGTPGIGAIIAKYQSRLQSPELFASILLASLFGVVIFLFFGWLARRAVGSWYDFG